MSATRNQTTDGPGIARWRIWAFVLGSVLFLGAAAGYSVYAAQRHSSEVASTAHAFSSTVPLSGTPKILYMSTAVGADEYHLAEVPESDAGASPDLSTLKCERSYAAAGTLSCLNAGSALNPTQYTEVYQDTTGTPKLLTKIPLPGNPSRTRVSPDGRLVAWTVFVSGDSYNGPQFSTRTGVYDVKTGTVIQSLETFTAKVNGKIYKAVDINYWGITFEPDDVHFYVTMGSAGQTWLMRGDLATRTLTSVISNVECPSLSPDGTRIVFKKRVSTNLATPWRLYVLDLATLKETPLAETRSIDDQAAWLGDDTVMYQVPSPAGYDIWAVPADGTGTPRLLIRNGKSPVVVGGS
ncbi:PD40 domain-containing protein [Actinospica robiniae]|uniref:PD40 domain-containing protein n=1 Tax=Actinospica robiniae TaxID=304901 RepID=UPI0004122DDA|nr:PD40 domain-containing protein [Actinospica robiniae]